MKKIKVYGIKNCDTVKKAMSHLADRKYEIEFIDYKKTQPCKEKLNTWFNDLKEYPVNKKGTTYRKVGAEFEALKSHDKKIQFMIENSSMIVRPIIEDASTGAIVSVGKNYEDL